MTIKLIFKTVYGNDTFYPDCPISKEMALMLGQKTLTRTNLKHIKAMGFSVDLKPYGWGDV